MSDSHEVKCHLCGDIFSLQANTDTEDSDCRELPTLFYCDNCSTQKIRLECSNCGIEFQGLPIRNEQGQAAIQCLCESCSDKLINDMVLRNVRVRN